MVPHDHHETILTPDAGQTILLRIFHRFRVALVGDGKIAAQNGKAAVLC